MLVIVHVASAENTAVTLHAAPFAGTLFIVYACGLVKGALNTCVPPHEFVTVSVPLAGAFVKVIFPFKVKVFVPELHAPGVAVNAVMEQVHAAGAV